MELSTLLLGLLDLLLHLLLLLRLALLLWLVLLLVPRAPSR